MVGEAFSTRVGIFILHFLLFCLVMDADQMRPCDGYGTVTTLQIDSDDEGMEEPGWFYCL